MPIFAAFGIGIVRLRGIEIPISGIDRADPLADIDSLTYQISFSLDRDLRGAQLMHNQVPLNGHQ